MYRVIRFSALAVTAAILLFSGSGIAGGSAQKPDEQTEASLLTTAEALPDVGVVLKKKDDRPFAGGFGKMRSKSPQKPAAAASKPIEKPEGQSTSNKKTNKDGSFSFENVPPGTYNLTFDAPKVSPSMVGKVEYLVIVQQVEASAGASATQTYDDSKPKTARIPIAKIKDGLDFTVGPPPPGNVSQASKPNTKKKASDSQTAQSPPAMMSKPMNLRGKIFLVEIGTTRIVRDQSGVRTPNQY